MFCPRCGAQNADDAKVCAACGVEMAQQPPTPDYHAPAAPPKTSPAAIWSLVLGAVGLLTCGLSLLEIPGLILGIIGLKRINEKPEELTGKGIAIAGIVTSALAILAIGVGILLSAILFPVFNRARYQAQIAVCQNNVRQLCQSAMLYSQDYDGKYPPAASWCDAVKTYTKSPTVYKDPGALGKECGYGFNSALGGISEGDIANAAGTVMIFESDNGWNANGGRDAMITKSRHGICFVLGYADSHVTRVSDSNLNSLIWEPTH